MPFSWEWPNPLLSCRFTSLRSFQVTSSPRTWTCEQFFSFRFVDSLVWSIYDCKQLPRHYSPSTFLHFLFYFCEISFISGSQGNAMWARGTALPVSVLISRNVNKISHPWRCQQESPKYVHLLWCNVSENPKSENNHVYMCCQYSVLNKWLQVPGLSKYDKQAP